MKLKTPYLLLVCEEINYGRVAIIAVGNSPTFQVLQAIAVNLQIPYITVKNSLQKQKKKVEQTEISHEQDEVKRGNIIHMHPPVFKLMRSIIDLINHYKWDYLTILYHESYGFDRIQNLINLSGSSQKTASKYRIRVRQLSSNIDEWIYLIKDVKLSGTSHIIVDIETKYLNEFIKQVRYLSCIASITMLICVFF